MFEPLSATSHYIICRFPPYTGLHEFQSLLKNFLESKQLKIGEDLTENSIERRKERLGKPTDHNVNYLRDKELANEWRDFHGKNANRRKI